MKRILTCALLMALTTHLMAHDFVVTQNGQKLYFNIIDKAKRTAEVTYGGSIVEQYSKPVGNIVIPEKVQHGNNVYTITSIGKKAFSNASGLTSVVIPTNVKVIDDFAFEGCKNLKNVIFPANPVKLGQGTFYLCTSIENVTFGSEWTQIDLAIFRWSNHLEEVTIPVKVNKLYNVKKLKGLKKVSVDSNNQHYKSVDGIIYSKNGEALLACPRSYGDVIKVAEGTMAIKIGALIDCCEIKEVDFPKSLNVVSFRELSRMDKLEKVTLRSEKPMTTAKIGNTEVLLFQISALDVEINVPKASQKAYKLALATADGEYMEKSAKATVPYVVKTDAMPKAKNIIGVKNL